MSVRKPHLVKLSRSKRAALVAVWGKIKLEQLDTAEVSQPAAGGKLHKGFLVSYLGDIQRSAKAKLPVYRLAGGAGFWAASFDSVEGHVLSGPRLGVIGHNGVLAYPMFKVPHRGSVNPPPLGGWDEVL
jgi:hypothetical protein